MCATPLRRPRRALPCLAAAWAASFGARTWAVLAASGLACAAVAAAALQAGAARAQATAPVGQTIAPACPPSRRPGAADYQGLTLTMCNFSGQDLAGADFAEVAKRRSTGPGA